MMVRGGRNRAHSGDGGVATAAVIDRIEDTRWRTGGADSGYFGRQPHMAQDAADDTRVFDDRDETQPSPALGARQDIEAEAPLH